MKRMIESPGMSVKIGHAREARSEMKTLADEFGLLIGRTDVPTPAIERLNRYLDPETEPVPVGSSEMTPDWTPIWVTLGLLVLLAVAATIVLR